ncbi:MAG: hypothetical protein V1851_00235 [Patescibacteria group bacterium]
MQTLALKINNLDKRMVFWILVFSSILLMVSYFYLIIQSTVNVTTYRTMEEKIINLNTKLGEYEFQYMALKSQIDLEMAKTLGFAETSDVHFVDKSLASNAISFVKNNH